jgi:hypothetical protein
MTNEAFDLDPEILSHIKNKTMGSLTPVELDDARELWLRQQFGWMPKYHQEFYSLLLRRIDELRKGSK